MLLLAVFDRGYPSALPESLWTRLRISDKYFANLHSIQDFFSHKYHGILTISGGTPSMKGLNTRVL